MRPRTKHAPRWPSWSLQSRGHRSHWMRPSSNLCQYLAGYCSAMLIGSSILMFLRVPGQMIFGFAPFGHGIAQQFHVFSPEVIGQPGLASEHPEKLARLREAFPDLRQKCAAISAEFKNDAVHAGTQLGQCIGLVPNLHRLCTREQRNLDCSDVEFLGAQRCK